MPKIERLLNSPMRELVRVAIFVKGGEADLSDIQSFVRMQCDRITMHANWKVQVRDVLKHDPDIEKGDDGSWVLRTAGFDLV